MNAKHTGAVQERVKFWHDSTLDNLELLRATYITHVFAPHAHEGFAIGVIETGAQTFIYQRANRLVMSAGTIAVVNPGEIHIGQSAVEGGWTYRMLYPDAGVLQTIASQMLGRERDIPFFPNPVIQDAVVYRLIQDLHIALESPVTSPLERQSRLWWALGHLITRHSDDRHTGDSEPSDHVLVQKARDYLQARYADNISLDELATYVNISSFHLLRLFKREIGLAPHAFQTYIRVTRAKTLLMAGESLAQVAAATGFADQSHLSRHFKRIVGVSPGQYRTLI